MPPPKTATFTEQRNTFGGGSDQPQGKTPAVAGGGFSVSRTYFARYRGRISADRGHIMLLRAALFVRDRFYKPLKSLSLESARCEESPWYAKNHARVFG
jgi:hypothetical protein